MAKKAFFTMVAAAGMLTLGSCSQDEVITSVTDQGDEIAFTATTNRLSRGADVTTDNLQSIYVTAFLRDRAFNPNDPEASPDAKTYYGHSDDTATADCLFADQKFSKGTDGFFHIDGRDPFHWPGSGQYATFLAYAPSFNEMAVYDVPPHASGEWGPNYDSYFINYFCVKNNIEDQVDLITSTPITDHRDTGNTGAHTANLQFHHRLAAIEFRVKNDGTSDISKTYNVNIAGVKLFGVIRTGHFDMLNATWDISESKQEQVSYNYKFKKGSEIVTVGTTAASVMGEAGSIKTIPCHLSEWKLTSDPVGAYVGLLMRVARNDDGRVVFPYTSDYQFIADNTNASPGENFRVYTGADGQKYQWAAIPLALDLQMGKKYIITLDLSKGVGYNDPGDNPTGPGGERILDGEVNLSVNVEEWTAGNYSTENPNGQIISAVEEKSAVEEN